LRREERDKAAEDLKSALHKVNAEAQEEIKRQAEAHLRQQREQKEVISKLQESEKEIRLLVETLRSKLVCFFAVVYLNTHSFSILQLFTFTFRKILERTLSHLRKKQESWKLNFRMNSLYPPTIRRLQS
jgi:hypothetical protein